MSDVYTGFVIPTTGKLPSVQTINKKDISQTDISSLVLNKIGIHVYKKASSSKHIQIHQINGEGFWHPIFVDLFISIHLYEFYSMYILSHAFN